MLMGSSRLRGKLKRLQRALQDSLESIEQADGTRYWFDPEEEAKNVFLYFAQSCRSVHERKKRPEPPPIVKAVRDAQDRQAAFAKLPMKQMLPLDVEVLVEEGRCVPRCLVAGRDVDESVPDLSEP